MKAVWPSSADAALKSLLATRQFVMAECFSITTVYGDTIYWTTAQYPITVVPFGGSSPVTYTNGGVSGSLLVSGVNMHASIGTNVDSQALSITAKPTDLIGQLPVLTAIRFGMFDGARITRDRWFAADWGTTPGGATWVGCARMFSGRMGTVEDLGQTRAKLKVKSDLGLLAQNYPREVFQPGCLNALYDSQCTLNRASFTTSGTVGAGPPGPSSLTIPWSAASARYKLGIIRFTNGVNTNQRRTIKAVSAGTLIISYPLPEAPSIGDTFTATYGCSKSLTDATNGCAAFANQANFRGFPFVPPPEQAI